MAELTRQTRGPVARGRLSSAARATHALTPGESAWLAALPCALTVCAIVVLLGPPLGRALFEPVHAYHIWPRFYQFGALRPEPTEHARYVLALTAPLLLLGAARALRGRRAPFALAAAGVALAQTALVAFVVLCTIAQRDFRYEARYAPRGSPYTIYFTNTTLVVAVGLAVLAALLAAWPAAVALITRLTRETPMRRALAVLVAAGVTVAFLLSAYNTDGTINVANDALWNHMAFYVDEAASILNGQAPLVDFHAQYGQLWAYIAAGGMALFGASLGVYAAIMLAGTAATMAAVFATLRRIVGGSSLLALALFAPFVATSFFMKLGPPDNRYSPAGLFSLFPIRYAGPYVLLWLLVRRCDTGSARRPLALLALGGLVVINNPEFGVPAVGATLVALAWTLPGRSLRGLARLALEALGGGAIAVALVSVLTLTVGGGLPHFGQLLEYPRIFGVEGFGLLAMPSVGFHLVVYATFVGAIGVGAVRGLAGEDRALSVALTWIGIFGLGVGAYFTGRSHPHVLIDLFSVWSYALALLAVVAIRAIVRRPGHRPQLAELLVLAGVGVMACSLAQTPTPRSQIDRLRASQPHDVRILTALEDTINDLTSPGEPVAMLVRPGHLMAERIGIVDVNPYANVDSMMTSEQWSTMIAALQRAHGRKLFVQGETLFQEHIDWLERRGYRPYRESRQLALIEFIRSKPPRPRHR
jgi:hypothetical protein